MQERKRKRLQHNKTQPTNSIIYFVAIYFIYRRNKIKKFLKLKIINNRYIYINTVYIF